MRRALPLLLFVVSLPLAAATLEGRWQGSIRLAENGVSEASVDVTFTPRGDGWDGEIHIGAVTPGTVPLAGVALAGARLMVLVPGPGNPTFNGTLAGDKLSGDFRIDGKTYPFLLTRARP